MIRNLFCQVEIDAAAGSEDGSVIDDDAMKKDRLTELTSKILAATSEADSARLDTQSLQEECSLLKRELLEMQIIECNNE